MVRVMVLRSLRRVSDEVLHRVIDPIGSVKFIWSHVHESEALT
jgi:hypothetical protein